MLSMLKIAQYNNNNSVFNQDQTLFVEALYMTKLSNIIMIASFFLKKKKSLLS